MYNTENSNVIAVDIEKEMRKSFLDYSMSVIVSRALPDVRDGLKPVHRRILYTMHEDGLTPEKPYRKCATAVGDVLGRYHPHGDMSVYDALVRLAQDFSLRYPNIGSLNERLDEWTGDSNIVELKNLNRGRYVAIRKIIVYY